MKADKLSLPICHYVWTNLIISISLGPPGVGKSTIAQRLSRDHGYVYYEADAFFLFCNPFNDPNAENPSFSTMKQAPLKVSRFHAIEQFLGLRKQTKIEFLFFHIHYKPNFNIF